MHQHQRLIDQLGLYNTRPQEGKPAFGWESLDADIPKAVCGCGARHHLI